MAKNWNSFLIISLIPISSLLISACGKNYSEHVEKDYRLSLASDDPVMQSAFASFVDRYNNEIGFQAITLVSPEANANSEILVTPGLKNRDNKIGWGQWIKTIEAPSESQIFNTNEQTKVIKYSMRVEFDDTYLRNRIGSDASSSQKKEAFRLFAHEVGHGFTLDHDPNPISIMYEQVLNNEGDFKGYYESVREFFNRGE